MTTALLFNSVNKNYKIMIEICEYFLPGQRIVILTLFLIAAIPKFTYFNKVLNLF